MSYALKFVEVDLSNEAIKERSEVQIQDIIIKDVEDIIIHGKVYDDNNNPVENAVVKVFYTNDNGNEVGYCHVFTDSDGEYMVNLPYEIFNEKKIKVKAVKTNKIMDEQF
ncbi:carboxypeptidase regulatory-like domain-containing protein [Clostridium sp. NSJ-6]|uniref:Carboxypeptidase regulatory-like domain-containing protein n=1 Tax=Clostridium hominis TaxID=2763036 RepID=A0ABR7DAY4_9CLOT|nr:carboxypeptidase regulatory-like domain-containing protein [Clostridium hominis]MBC5628549.1 carboxypeptidase regulatory-like domain-containing protein [Clostridium hominis]MDU2672298.1 carboxypeptidase regulatory-like domain-containing protein [Clostridium sp.]